MPRENMPRLLAALADQCAARRFADKILLSPNRRIGQQWLDRLARNGQPVINVRLHTAVSLAVELAGGQLQDRQLVTPLGRTVMTARLLRQLGSGYLGELRPSLALAERLAATLRDLRLAGIETADLERGQFEAPTKGPELLQLFQAYRQALADKKLLDEADLFRLAIAAPPTSATILLPSDLDLGPLERKMLARQPVSVLPVDEAPAPAFTEAFRAVGETNELREILRRCLANGWPLDQVEILHTDAETYVSRLHELAAQLEVPVTFAEGIPIRYSRPGRALAAWLAWVNDDFPQPALVAMIRDGLLNGMAGNLAAALRVVPIGFGRDRYLAQIDVQLHALAAELTQPETDEDGEPRIAHRASVQRRHEALLALRDPVAQLLALARRSPLEAAAEFLTAHARCLNELDNYTRDLLLERIAELASWNVLWEGASDPDRSRPEGRSRLNEREWLLALLRETRIRGEGPWPGHLYITGWETGGHSGRPHTFIVGLDANRFPPAGRQDPVLLDSERQILSPDLRTVAAQRERGAQNFARLLARLRGAVTASYSCRSVSDNAEQVAALTLPATKIVADAPACENEVLSTNEWWLWRLCVAGPVANASALVGECFPWLGRGLRASWDGLAPAAGPDLDPAGGTDRQFSPHRLETIGTCPLKYFYRYALKLEKPEELELDPQRWLPPVEFGKLLHETFCRHLRDGVALGTVLAERIDRYREKIPPPNEGVFRRDCRRLHRALREFAAEDFAGKPIDFERKIEGIPVALPDGTKLHVYGTIDRVDETAAGLELWDYKTGGTRRYRTKPGDPFNGGRILQHAIYMELAKAKYGKPVALFGYFFPSEKGRGERITFTPGQLAGAPELLARLRGLVARGEFVPTDDLNDCTFCDYRSICRR